MRRRENIKAYLYLAPALVLSALFLFYPLLNALISSFLKITQNGKVLGPAGLGNYRMLFQDAGFINALKNTALFALFFIPINFAITLLAATVTRKKTRLSACAEFIFASPIVISLSAYALIFREIFRGRVSIINRILSFNVSWLSEKASAMAVLVILGIFLDFGLNYLLLLSSFRSIDRSVIEASWIDGAEKRHTYFFIELPMIRKMLAATLFLALKNAIMISSPVIILTEGGPFRSTETIMFYYYIEAFKSGNRAIQNTLSVLMTLIFCIGMFVASKRRNRA